MTLGLVVRCDSGGLAAQSFELWLHLKPDRILLVDLPDGQCRGTRNPDRYTGDVTRVTTNVIPESNLVEFASTVDVLLTVECLYAPPSTWHAVNQHTRTVLVANPELLVDSPATHIVLPTSWEAHRVPGSTVLPHPVDLGAIAHRRAQRGTVGTFLHVEAPAMLDRNGSRTVAAALAHVTEPCTLIVRSYQPQSASDVWRYVGDQVGCVRVVWDDRCVASHWDGYTDDVDVLVLPRRYGGLSLVAQEAAALGIPSIMLDVDPQRSEGWPGWRVHAWSVGVEGMRGGGFAVHDTDPRSVAQVMSRLVSGDLDVAAGSRAALEWSASRSWSALLPAWQKITQTDYTVSGGCMV